MEGLSCKLFLAEKLLPRTGYQEKGDGSGFSTARGGIALLLTVASSNTVFVSE